MFLLPTVHRKERSLPCIWSRPNKGASDFRMVLSHRCAPPVPWEPKNVLSIPNTKIPQGHLAHLSETELGSFIGAMIPEDLQCGLQTSEYIRITGARNKGLLKCRLLGLTPRFLNSASLGWGPRIRISNKFPKFADPAGPGTTL